MSETRYTVFPDFEDDEGFIEESGELIPSEENESFHYDPIVTTPAYHIEQGEKALEKLKKVINEGGWKKAITVKNTTVYTKSGAGGLEKAPIFMCQHIIEGFSPQSIFAVIGMRKLWDPWYEEGNLIDNLNDSTSLTYMVMQGVAGTRIRDLSLVEKIQCAQDGTIYFAATSVEKVPHVVDRIRAYLHLNGWIIKPISYNPLRTKVTYVLQTKVNGWVPSVVAKKYLTRRPLVVHIIDQYLQKNGPPPMVISASPSSSNPQSRNGSNASFFPPRNQIDVADQQRNKFKRENTFKDKNDSLGKSSLDSQNRRREITFNFNNDNNQSFKKEIVRKTSFDIPSIQTNRPFYSNNNNTFHALSFKKELHRKTSLDSLKMQNVKKETFFHSENDIDLSSQSSQVTLDELHPPPKLSPALPTSPSLPALSTSPTTLPPLPKLPTSPTSPTLPSLPPIPTSASPTFPASPVSPTFPTFPVSPTLPVLPTLPPTSPRRFQFPLPPLDQETVPIQTQPTSPVQSKPYVPPPPSSPPLSLPPTPPQIKYQHDDAINAAVTTFKDNIKTLEGWDLYSESKGVKIYTKDVADRSTPIIRGDYTLIGNFTADDFLSVIKNLDIRKFWDDRYDDGENVKLFDNDNILSKVSLKGTFPISGRDFVLCGKVERDQETSTIYFVTTSVTDTSLPEVKKYVRGQIHFAGWKIIPKFDTNGNTKALGIIYVVDTDIKLDSVPSAILKSISTGTPMVIQKIDDMMQKIGFPPYIMNSSSLIVSENLHPKNFQYNLSFVAKNNGFTDIRFSKKMYPNGFDIIIPNSVKVELLPDDQEIVRIIHPSDVSGIKIQIRITKYTDGFKMTYNEKDRIPLAKKKVDPRPELSTKNIPITTNYSSARSAQPISQFETVQKSQNLRHSRHSKNFSQPINVNSTPVENGIVDADIFDEQSSFAFHRQQRHSRNFSNPVNLNTTNKDNTNDEQDSLTSLNQRNQRHSRKSSQLVDPNATLVSDEIVDKVQQDRTSKRKSKRLSFADSPSIINPSTFYEKEENFISEVISAKNGINEKNKYVADIVSDEYENLEEYEDIIKTFNETPFEQYHTFNFNEDLFVITDNVKFNAYQATIMFVGMILSYYSGRLSCYFI